MHYYVVSMSRFSYMFRRVSLHHQEELTFSLLKSICFLNSYGSELGLRKFSLMMEWNTPKHVGGARCRHETRVKLVSVKNYLIYANARNGTLENILCVSEIYGNNLGAWLMC